MSWDVIIVGAGPAGSAAAYDLAQQGFRTLILEKQQFPRLKPCAGGLTIKALTKLRFSISHLIQQRADSLIAGYGLGKQVHLSAASPICVFTVRQEFDHFCLNQALAQGAELHYVDGLTTIEDQDEGVTLATRCGKRYQADYLIGADGAHSQVRRLLSAFTPDRTAVALEALLPWEEIPKRTRSAARYMTLDFGAQPLGYGWVFPKQDHVNVGLFTYLPTTAKLSKQTLADYAMHRLGTHQFAGTYGYPIATGGEYYRQESNRVLLVGDAAGMAEPLLGEGIHNAITTGQAAAAGIIAHQAEAHRVRRHYQQAIGAVQADILFSRRLAPWFYRCLPLAYQALIRYPVANVFMNGYAAGLTLQECRNAFARFTTQFDVPNLAI